MDNLWKNGEKSGKSSVRTGLFRLGSGGGFRDFRSQLRKRKHRHHHHEPDDDEGGPPLQLPRRKSGPLLDVDAPVEEDEKNP